MRWRVLLFGCLIAVALRVFPGVRWTNPAGSHYVDAPDSADARGSFVRSGFLFTLRVEGGQFSVWAWDMRKAAWTPWSRGGIGQPFVQGDVDHVIAVGPRGVSVLLDTGGNPTGLRRCESWSVEIDDSARTLTWTRRGVETPDLGSISNFASEAEAYYGAANAERLGTQSSPANIREEYVIGSATKRDSVAFGVGDGLHVYSLPNRTIGSAEPAIARTFALTTAQIAGTTTGWFMIARMSPVNSWRGQAIVFVSRDLDPTSVIPLPAGFHSYLETAGDANVVFDPDYRFAWRIRGNDAELIEWSHAVPHGHIAATADSRWLFLTNGEQIAVPVTTAPAARYSAAGLRILGTTVVVSRRAEWSAGAMAIAVVVLLVVLTLRRARPVSPTSHSSE